MSGPSEDSIRGVQRKNGKIIIRAMMEIKKGTFESIVEKICSDYNVSYTAGAFKLFRVLIFYVLRFFTTKIFTEKLKVENAVRSFLKSGYYLGFLDVDDDESFSLNQTIKDGVAKQLDQSAKADESSHCCQPQRKKKR